MCSAKFAFICLRGNETNQRLFLYIAVMYGK